MPKGYVIFTEETRDQAALDAYVGQAVPTLTEHNGRPIVVDDAFETVEGTWHGSRIVIVEFDSVDAAKAWYNSPAYQAVKPLREAAADCNVVIVGGFEMPS